MSDLLKKPKKIIVRTHYASDDEECSGDYYDVEILFDGEVVQTFGDYYHDKGRDKVGAWLYGVERCLGKLPKVKEEDVADRDY